MIELIAEVSTNHGGSIGRAVQFIDAFAKAGANTIKFQYTRAHRLAKDDPQKTWFEQAELGDGDFGELADFAAVSKVGFMLTVYHPDDVENVRRLTDNVKVGSGEAHSEKLATAIQQSNFKRVVVSNGLRPPHPLYGQMGAQTLACISRYPHPSALVPAQFVESFADGWSDHCHGLDGAMIAVHLGARLIEKHVQLREQARPPQAYEATVEEFIILRQWVDKSPERFLGRWNHGG